MKKVASFTIPLGATINMSGTAIMQGVAVVFVAQAFGIDLSTSALMTVVITAVTAAIGTAGVPGVGTIMLAMVFESVGLPAAGIAMIMGVDRILDMGCTARERDWRCRGNDVHGQPHENARPQRIPKP